MEFSAIKQLLLDKFGDGFLQEEESTGLQPALVIHKTYLRAVCQELKDNENTWFDFLSCISGIDYGVNEGFGVVYHLASIPYQKQLTLKVRLENSRDSEQLPFVDSVADIWKTADWHEREAFDLVGIYFEGHPDLRRVLLPDDWQGYPLRKDYTDAESYHGIPIK